MQVGKRIDSKSNICLFDPSQYGELPPIPYVDPDKHAIDVYKELVHAADTVRWIARLTEKPSIELFLAGQNHDWERIVYPGSTGGFAGKRDTPEYLAHKKRHAIRSTILVYQKLKSNRFSEYTCQRVAFLILHHDDTGEEIRKLNDPELQILVSADSMSFFSVIFPEMLSRGESEDRVRGKMKFMIGKMDEYAREILATWKSPDERINRWKDIELNQV